MTTEQIITAITKLGLAVPKCFGVADLIDRIVYDELIEFKKWLSDYNEQERSEEHEKELVEKYLKQKAENPNF